MRWYTRVALTLAVSSACATAIRGQEPPAKPKAKVELRWLEVQRIEGLTEDKGFQTTDDPMDIVYPHKKPALELTTAEVADARLIKHDFTNSGSGVVYRVEIDLTKEARAKLAASVEGKESRLLTVVVNGKCWGCRRYEKDKDNKSIPDQALAETFQPDVGYFSSEAEAQRLVEALVLGQEKPAKPKARIELRWVEFKPIDGVTEGGIPSSDDPNSIVYPRRKPALVLTAAEVSEVTMKNYDLSGAGLLKADNYDVSFHLTKEARDKLAEACGDQESRQLTVFVDGACCQGLQWYHKGRVAGASAGDRAESFIPVVGFMPKARAERLVDAVK